jgi:hypothetical protein
MNPGLQALVVPICYCGGTWGTSGFVGKGSHSSSRAVSQLCARVHRCSSHSSSRRRAKPTEFLTHQTTCASEMLEKTTCKNFYGWRRVARAAWANAGTGVPPSPNPARRLAGWQVTAVGHAALAVAGRVTWRMPAGFGSGGSLQQ